MTKKNRKDFLSTVGPFLLVTLTLTLTLALALALTLTLTLTLTARTSSRRWAPSC